jgi:hypothetical protein
VFHSGNGAANPDGLVHDDVTSDASGRVFVSFEDMLGGGDMEFNDHAFSFSNESAVPTAGDYVLPAGRGQCPYRVPGPADATANI